MNCRRTCPGQGEVAGSLSGCCGAVRVSLGKEEVNTNTDRFLELLSAASGIRQCWF